MNAHEHDYDDPLAQRLRGLPAERVPPAAVWQRVAAAMEQVPRAQPPVAAPMSSSPTSAGRARGGVWLRYAAAAVVVVAVLASAAMWWQPQPPAAPMAMQESALQRQANTITYQYRQAMASMPHDSVPVELQPALRELDESAGSIRSAIAQSPDATFLLGQLQRTYALRLELTRKGVNPTGIST